MDPDMLQKLNNMTEAFVNEFNYVHSQGYALNDPGDFTDPSNPKPQISK